MNTTVDLYLEVGCGRCSLGGTPECKVHSWGKELVELRRIVLHCGLHEEIKWGVPCYTSEGSNVLIVSAFRGFCSVNFFKGALLQDSENLLVKPGPNSQSGRLMKFTNVKQILENESHLEAYIYEAIEVEKAGLKVVLKKELGPLPEELLRFFASDPELETAFYALTLGRQRGYLIHISGAKQSKTRIGRIEKSRGRIFAGKGYNER